MCDPITIAGAALTGAGIAAKSVADSQVQRARKNTMLAERLRQQQLQDEANRVTAQSISRYNGFQGQQDAKSKELGDYFGAQAAPVVSAATATADAPASSSNLTVQEQARQQDKASAFTGQQATARGDMRSFGDLLGGISRLQGRDAQRIGQIGGFEQGSAGVLPYELENANGAGNGMKMLGDILGGVGKIGVTAGLSGGLGGGDMFKGLTDADFAPGNGVLTTLPSSGRMAVPAVPMSGFGSIGSLFGAPAFNAVPSMTRAPAFRGLY